MEKFFDASNIFLTFHSLIFELFDIIGYSISHLIQGKDNLTGYFLDNDN